MSEQHEGKVTVSLKTAVELVKRNHAQMPSYVKTISDQNRAIREARRTLPALESRKPSV